jgi:hypothetical protein
MGVLSAGAIAGVSAAWAMARFTSLWIRAVSPRKASSSRSVAAGTSHLSQDDRATAALIRVAALHLLSRTLTTREERAVVPLVRYGFGAATGAAYGLLTFRLSAGVITGAVWGIALWLIGDEIVLPLLERSSGALPEPRAAHAQAFAAHIVYGITTDAVHRTMWRAAPCYASARPLRAFRCIRDASERITGDDANTVYPPRRDSVERDR